MKPRFLQQLLCRLVLMLAGVSLSLTSALLASETRAPSRITPYQRYFLLLAACRAGDEIAVGILLEAGADPNGGEDYETEAIGGRYGFEFTSPLSAAAAANQITVMELLLKHGAAVDIMEGEGYTPLVVAVISKKFEATKLLLSVKASTRNPFLIKALDCCDDSRITELFGLIITPTEAQLAPAGVLADKEFCAAISTALEEKNWRWVASQIAYPVEVKNGGSAKTVNTPEEFLVSTEGLRSETLRQELLSQCKQPLFTNWRGSMIGNGSIWFTACHARTYDQGPWVYRILAIGGFAFQVTDEVTGPE